MGRSDSYATEFDLEADECGFLEVSKVDMLQLGLTSPKTNMAIENPPFEDLFSLENGDFWFSIAMSVFGGVHWDYIEWIFLGGIIVEWLNRS